MAEAAQVIALRRRLSLFGFGAVLAPFYAIVFVGSDFGPAAAGLADRLYDLALILAALICTFGVLLFLGRRREPRPDSVAVPWMAAGALASAFCASQAILLFNAEGFGVAVPILRLICGCALAVLLYGWGRALGTLAIGEAVPTTFIGTALAAVFAFLLTAIPWRPILLLLGATPLLGAALLTWLTHLRESARPQSAETLPLSSEPPDRTPEAADRSLSRSLDRARRLSLRLGAGMVLFGFVLGIAETFLATAAQTYVNVELELLLLILFSLAALQLFRSASSPLEPPPTTMLLSARPERGPLDGAYRLATLLLLAGFGVMPLLQWANVAPGSIVMAGSMAMLTVFMALFLVMGSIAATDAGLEFGRGFVCFFSGELAGVVGAWLLGLGLTEPLFGTIAMTVAGLGALIAYLFVFTDRDMCELSLVVDDVDRFEALVGELGRRYKLSARELEVATLALRGRSSERIAQELTITKNTVDTHLRRIYRKCGVHGRQELIDLTDRLRAGEVS